MFQIKIFKAVNKSNFESSINNFLESKKEEIKEIIDIKISVSSEERPNYTGTVIYKI